ncbi:hypothetical protein HDV05_007747, partial [Chytridiales sp. JEL 0842]
MLQTLDSFPALLQTSLGCPRSDGSTIRYHLSSFCGALVDTSLIHCPSTEPAAAVVVGVCRSSVTKFLDSFNAILDNPELCDPPTPEIAAARSDFLRLFQTLQSNLPSDGGGPSCVDAELTDKAFCGFTSSQQAIHFCTSTSGEDACCASVEGFTA